MPTQCHVHNCAKPSVSKGLCDTHRKRRDRHGTTEQTRPADWGQKEKHPAYQAWCGLRRSHRLNMPESWAADFWAFVADVPQKPDGRVQMQRADTTAPWSKDNFYWKEPIVDTAFRADKAAYMREWSRKARAANPEYHKSAFLRRHYKITIADYDAMLAAQDGKCAICGKAEANEIRGKVISLSVDHDHATGAVRALLCTGCNTGIGLLRDDAELIRKAADYIDKHRES